MFWQAAIKMSKASCGPVEDGEMKKRQARRECFGWDEVGVQKQARGMLASGFANTHNGC